MGYGGTSGMRTGRTPDTAAPVAAPAIPVTSAQPAGVLRFHEAAQRAHDVRGR